MAPSQNVSSPSFGLDEPLRLAALADLHTVDSGAESCFDRIVRLATRTLDFPMGYVSLIDLNQQILKTNSGPDFCDGSRSDAICTFTIEQNSPLIIPDTHEDRRVAHLPQVVGAPHIRSYWGAPLTTRRRYNVGALCLVDVRPRAATPDDVNLLQEFARLTIETMELMAQASTDVLTGTQSRRAFQAKGEELFAADSEAPLSCIHFDVDHFKRINDAHGHVGGDHVLASIGALLLDHLGSEGPVGRLGGEEFAILLPGQGFLRAYMLAERLRIALMSMTLPDLPAITASFGVAERSGADDSLRDLIARADAASYVAKSAGRNRTRPTP